MIRSTRWVFLLALLGSLLLQTAWALVVPPFRGLDEHEHAYKAAAVVRGDFAAQHPPAPLGWGELVVVPRDLVEAAGPECAAFGYLTADNCTPGEDRGDGLVTVASSAAPYNPAFYAVVGWPSLMFEGVASLYAMRAAASLLCALLVAGAVVMTRRWSTTPWPGVALLLTTTPVFTYSTAMLAPNGVELAGALLLWVILLGHARRRDDQLPAHTVLAIAVVGAAPVALVRSLGPLWLVLTVLTALALRPDLARLLFVTRAGRIASAAVAVLVAGGAGWTLHAGTNAPSTGGNDFGMPTLKELAIHLVLWVFQSVAAFPARDELASLPLYAVAFLAWWLLGALAYRVADRRVRLVAWAAIITSAAVPLVLTVLTYDDLGLAWQGRYGYPFAMGIVLLCGWALDRGSARGDLLPLTLSASTLVTVQLIGLIEVLARSLKNSPQAGTDAWAAPSIWLIVLLATGGATLFTLALRAPTPEREPAIAGPDQRADNLGR